MKGFKTIFVAVATVLAVSFSAGAQENNNRDENGKVVRGAYETNKFWDNWFVGVGAGVNSAFDGGQFGNYGLAVDVNVGKWFTPSVGARLGWLGIQNEGKAIANAPWITGNDTKFGYNLVHADFLWNISNAISGYKETRLWDFVPYVRFGGLHYTFDNGKKDNWEYVAGAGLLNDLRLGEHVDLFLDLSAVVGRGASFRPKASGYTVFPSATVGLVFNLGKSNWERHSSITPVVIPVPYSLEQYNALKDKVAALEKENSDLKSKIAALESDLYGKVYKEGQTYVYKNGEFIETEAAISTPAALYFDLGKATLSERELAHLEYFAQNALADAKEVVITGAADSKTGSSKYNQTLSQKRADYVKDLLVKKFGVAAEKISANGVGGTDDYSATTPFKNRVVTVEVK